jgi:2-keto-4-pentenoate hydratase/2-oxohepta-3-ene-1,7-dioic acid hydratase in catechol pathway
MKLVTYSAPKTSSETHAGLLWGNWILNLQSLSTVAAQLDIKTTKRITQLSTRITSVLEALSAGAEFLEDLQSLSWRIFNRIDREKAPRTFKRSTEVRLRAPIPRPPVLRDFYAFEDHVKAARARRGLEMPKEWYEFPAFYYSNPTVIFGPDDDIPHPSYTEALDYELEIACVLGKTGIDIGEREAEAFIAGYTIMNDFSARDIQQKEMKIGLGPAKAKDFATSLGPWLVTPDELENKRTSDGKFDLRMTARVNGKQLSNGNAKNMHWTFPQMIARASQSVEVHAGEVFGSGTVGTGSLLELGQDVHPWLKSGDHVELEIDRLGVLGNKVIRSAKSKN